MKKNEFDYNYAHWYGNGGQAYTGWVGVGVRTNFATKDGLFGHYLDFLISQFYSTEKNLS